MQADLSCVLIVFIPRSETELKQLQGMIGDMQRVSNGLAETVLDKNTGEIDFLALTRIQLFTFDNLRDHGY